MTATPRPEQLLETSSRTYPWKFRLLGLLPLAFFTAHFIHYATAGYDPSTPGTDNMLWMCNVGNLMLAIGLLLAQPWMIRLSTIWLIPGLPIWLFEVVRNGGWLFTSFLTHIGGMVVGLFALSRVRADKWSWAYALVWYVIAQVFSRLLTSPFWNVNVAHRVYDAYQGVVSRYWQFWLITTAMVATGLFVIGMVLYKLFPPAKTAPLAEG